MHNQACVFNHIYQAMTLKSNKNAANKKGLLSPRSATKIPISLRLFYFYLGDYHFILHTLELYLIV